MSYDPDRTPKHRKPAEKSSVSEFKSAIGDFLAQVVRVRAESLQESESDN